MFFRAVAKLFVTAVVVGVALAVSTTANGAPLLAPGKTLLYQRVLTRPEAYAVVQPRDPVASGKPLPPFTPYFVYDRKKVGNEEWVKIGSGSTGQITGWALATSVMEWDQTLTIAFANSAGRNRLAFFRNKKDLESIITDENAVPRMAKVVKDLEAGLVGPKYPAVALEPAHFVDIKKKFYLLPILDFADTLNYDMYDIRMLKVASASVQEIKTPVVPAASTTGQPPKLLAGQQTAQTAAQQQTGFSSQQVAQQPAPPFVQTPPAQQLGQQLTGQLTAGQVLNTPPRQSPQPPIQTAGQQHPQPAVQQQSQSVSVGAGKIGVAFVIDTTSSMGPYIDRTRQIIEAIGKGLQAEGMASRTSFALIGYRDNISVAPGLQYVSKTFVPLTAGTKLTAFEAAAKQVAAATTSSRGFDEDVYAGVYRAIQSLDWKPFDGARFIVVIGDAGARKSNDPLGSTGLGAAQLQQLAQNKQIAVMAIHLLTAAGKADHQQAQSQFEQLTNFPGAGPLYFPVEAGKPNEFKSVLDTFTQQLVNMVYNYVSAPSASTAPSAAQNPSATAPAGVAPPAASAPVSSSAATSATPAATITGGGTPPAAVPAFKPPPGMSAASIAKVKQLQKRLAQVGLAMRLVYLGRAKGDVPPSVFEAWVPDRDVAHPQKKALDVRVLMTKAELSDLSSALKVVIRQAQLGEIAPDTFFNNLQAAAAAMSRQQQSIAQTQQQFNRIGDINVLKEYLGDLPYKSKVMNITQRDWLSFSIGEQQEFIDNLLAKIRLYAVYHDDVDNWQDFGGVLSKDDALYPVPIDALP